MGIQDFKRPNLQGELPQLWVLKCKPFKRREEPVFDWMANLWQLQELLILQGKLEEMKQLPEIGDVRTWRKMLRSLCAFQKELEWRILKESKKNRTRPDLDHSGVHFMNSQYVLPKRISRRSPRAPLQNLHQCIVMNDLVHGLLRGRIDSP
jgi:hypothetical protein